MPDKKDIYVANGGSFRMNCNELANAVEYRLHIIIALFSNHVLGMVRQWQDLFYDSRYSSTTIDKGTNFKALAEDTVLWILTYQCPKRLMLQF